MADADIADRTWARDAALLKETVREAGALALSLFRTELKNWTKGASSPVSEADIAVNDLVERRLRSATPDYGWLSEESVDDDARLGKPLVQRLSPSPEEITLHPRIGSLALRLCRVADGSLDAAFAGGQSRDWDLAAANLIVQEANGRMTALSGDAIEYNRREVVHGVLVAAGQDRHRRIVEHFRNHRLP